MAWGTNTWGTGNWGDNPLDVSVNLTGIELTSVLGTVTGQLLNADVGTATAEITVDVFVTCWN
jgi:hypothetical protein